MSLPEEALFCWVLFSSQGSWGSFNFLELLQEKFWSNCKKNQSNATASTGWPKALFLKFKKVKEILDNDKWHWCRNGSRRHKKVTTSIATSSINNNIHCLISLTKTWMLKLKTWNEFRLIGAVVSPSPPISSPGPPHVASSEASAAASRSTTSTPGAHKMFFMVLTKLGQRATWEGGWWWISLACWFSWASPWEIKLSLLSIIYYLPHPTLIWRPLKRESSSAMAVETESLSVNST